MSGRHLRQRRIILQAVYGGQFHEKRLISVNFVADRHKGGPNGDQRSAAFSAVGKILGGYEPGFELVAGADPEAIERFVVLFVRGSPRLLLPPERPIMRSAIASFLGNHRFANLVMPFVQVASRAGGPLSRVSTDVSLTSRGSAASPLRELISGVLCRDDFEIALRLSFGRPNAKTVAMAISTSGDALCFAKFGSEAMTDDLVAHEGAILERFEGVDMPVIMPRLLYSGTWAGGRNVLITAPLQLVPLKRDARDAHRAADIFASRNFVVNSTLSDSAYWRRVVDSATSSGDHGGSRATLLASITRIEEVWGDSHLDFGASHGDWARANLGMIEGRIAALDWERCTELAPRGIDVAHFALSEGSLSLLGKSLFGRSLYIERAAESVRQYLRSAGLPVGNAEPLIMLALLEMVIRFRSARTAGLRSADSKFGPALEAGLRKWTP